MDGIFWIFITGEIDFLDFFTVSGIEGRSGGRGCDQLVEIFIFEVLRSPDLRSQGCFEATSRFSEDLDFSRRERRTS